MQENERLNDPTYHKRTIKYQYYKEKLLEKKHMESLSINPDTQGYLFESAIQSEKTGIWAKTKRTKTETFGWDVFNDDSLYRAHAKRTKKMDSEIKENPDMLETMNEDERLDRMAEEIE